MKLICGLFGLENLYGGEINSYIEISKMAEKELDDLRARVIEYESKIAAPTITADILRQFPAN